MTGIRIQANFQIVLKYNICKIHKSISGYEITIKFGLQHPFLVLITATAILHRLLII